MAIATNELTQVTDLKREATSIESNNNHNKNSNVNSAHLVSSFNAENSTKFSGRFPVNQQQQQQTWSKLKWHKVLMIAKAKDKQQIQLKNTLKTQPVTDQPANALLMH